MYKYELPDAIVPILKRKKGIIFDMDGTLLDSMSMWKELDDLFMGSLGIVPDEEYSRVVATMTLPDACCYICERYGELIPYTPKEVENHFLHMIDEYYREKLLIKPRVMPFIKELNSLGIKMIVATANEYAMSEAALIRNDVIQYMDGLITCTMAGAGKSSPAVYIKACEMLGLGVDDCVVFEDTIHSVNTAKQAGFTVVGVFDYNNTKVWNEICDISDYQISFY